MSKVREIIGSAAKAWDDEVYANEPYVDTYDTAVNDYIRCFSPEHVALMEALFEAWLNDNSIEYCDEIEAAGNAIIAYRHDHGLL